MIREVYVSCSYAPLGKTRPGYFVDIFTKEVYSIKWGYLHALAPFMGRYCISNNNVKEWVPYKAINSAKRTPTTPDFYRVPVY